MKKLPVLVWVLVSFTGGIFLGKFFNIPLGIVCLASGTLFFLSLFDWKKFSLCFLAIMFVSLGLLRMTDFQMRHKQDISYVAKYYFKKQISLRGRVSSDPTQRDFFNTKKTTFYLNVLQIKAPWGWEKKKGKVLINIFDDASFDYGDVLELQGKLHRPYNFQKDKNFSYRTHLQNQGIQYIVSVKKGKFYLMSRPRNYCFHRYFLKARKRLKNILFSHLSVNEAGIMSAFLLGDRSHIPKHIRELFVKTGTAHILAISGLHIGIIASIIFLLLKLFPLGHKLRLLLTICLLLLYAALISSRPSVHRAILMSVIFIGSLILEREKDIINTLTAAALVLLIGNPCHLFQVGFQLSFVSVWAIALFAPKVHQKINQCCSENKMMRFVLESLAISLIVWLAVLGIIAYNFNIITPITIIANVMVVPFMALLISLGLFLLGLGLISFKLASWCALCIKILLNFVSGVLFLLEKIPFAYFFVQQISLWHITIYYTILLFLIYGLGL